MKAIFAGVASSAAIIRSPSFSRDSLSRTTTNSPRAIVSVSGLLLLGYGHGRSYRMPLEYPQWYRSSWVVVWPLKCHWCRLYGH